MILASAALLLPHFAFAATAPAAQSKNTQAKPVLSAFDAEQRMSFGQRMNRWAPFITEAAKRFDVPQVWIRAVMQIESGGRTMLTQTQPMISSAGAMGLMQLMPATYQTMRRQYRLGADPFDPHDNILAGAAYLRWLRGKYPYPALFAAYNDGPGNLEERLRTGGLLPAETQNYLGSIAGKLNGTGGVSDKAHEGSVKFTKPNGSPVWVDAASAVSVRAPFPGEYAPGVLSVITTGRVHQGVRENVTTAKRTLRAHGGGV
jgi:soluble lytic murein transglycosylase-like protein